VQRLLDRPRPWFEDSELNYVEKLSGGREERGVSTITASRRKVKILCLWIRVENTGQAARRDSSGIDGWDLEGTREEKTDRCSPGSDVFKLSATGWLIFKAVVVDEWIEPSLFEFSRVSFTARIDSNAESDRIDNELLSERSPHRDLTVTQGHAVTASCIKLGKVVCDCECKNLRAANRFG
jgi:hypothetical protein